MINPGSNPGERLGVTLFVAAAVHAAVILGVGFTMEQGSPEPPPLIEITLAQSPSEETPEDYDFLAPEDQQGGGSAEEAMRPTEPSSLLTDPRDMSDLVSASPRQQPDPPADESRRLTTDDAEQQVPEPEVNEPQPESAQQREEIDASEQVARDIADTSERVDWDARYPSKRRINARTKAHDAAAYMQGWIDRIEQVGNLNYPDEARARGLTGRLIVEVTLAPDGEVIKTEILERSDHAVLDQAVRRVVELAAPFPDIPEDVLNGNDRLVITRTWEFVSGGRLEAR